MTSKEALEVLNNPLKKEHWNLQNEAYNLLTDLVEKDTPKKGLHLDDGFNGYVLSCPSCKNSINNVWSRAEYKPNYCHYCGQKLLW